MRTLPLLVAIVMGAGAPASADILYPDFSSTAGLTLNGAASQSIDRLRLTPSVQNLAGSAWFDTRQDVVSPWTTEFRVEMDGAAEGMTFVVQRQDLAALGSTGAGLGYDGIANCLAIELDTSMNLAAGDPSGNHLSVHTLGAGANSANESAALGSTSLIGILNDSTEHVVRIEYVPGTLRIFVDDLALPALQVAVDLDATLALDDGSAWVGFSASTGSAWQNHFVLSWSFTEQATVWSGNHAPAAPTITEPATDGLIVNPFDVHMETSPMDDPDTGDSHFCSDFEIWTLSPTEKIWITACITGPPKVHTHLGDGVFIGSHAGFGELKPQEAYVLRARHRDDSGDGWSDFGPWSERSFQTGSLNDFYPLLADDFRSTPAPEWTDADQGSDFVLPAGNPQPGIYLESATGLLLLAIEGLDGQSNVVLNPPPLDEHVAVRVRIEAGDVGGTLALPETDLVIFDHECERHRVLLPALDLPQFQTAYLWVSVGGATWYGDASQTEPDFSQLARGNDLPWVTTSGFELEVAAEGLQLPVNLAFVPASGPNPDDPHYYVTELYGTIRVVSNDGTLGTYASGLLNYNPTGNFPGSGEQGLTGIAVDPATGDVFASMLYDASGPHYPKIVRFTSTDGGKTAATQTTILDMAGESQGQSHQVSHVEVHPDGRLVCHMGDGFSSATALNLDSFRGKILRMELDGSAATDNPFFDAGNGISARDYVWVYGVRNPFGGAWRASDGFHYEVENGNSVDRIARVFAGLNLTWNGSDTTMFNGALYNWVPAHGPVNAAVVQPETFAGSGFPGQAQDKLYVTESGPTYAQGPQSRGKRITVFTIDANGVLVNGPETLVEYVGTGRATACAIAAGPDGLYFSELYADAGNNPTAPGARILRLRWVGAGEVDCGTIGTTYCSPAVPNSSGDPGVITATGSDEASENDVTLTATHLPPNQFGYFLTSQTQGFIANPGGSLGNLCLGGNIGRYAKDAQSSGGAGSFSILIDLNDMPTSPPRVVTPGETWNFTAWFRDVGGNSNFTDAVSVLFH